MAVEYSHDSQSECSQLNSLCLSLAAHVSVSAFARLISQSSLGCTRIGAGSMPCKSLHHQKKKTIRRFRLRRCLGSNYHAMPILCIALDHCSVPSIFVLYSDLCIMPARHFQTFNLHDFRCPSHCALPPPHTSAYSPPPVPLTVSIAAFHTSLFNVTFIFCGILALACFGKNPKIEKNSVLWLNKANSVKLRDRTRRSNLCLKTSSSPEMSACEQSQSQAPQRALPPAQRSYCAHDKQADEQV